MCPPDYRFSLWFVARSMMLWLAVSGKTTETVTRRARFGNATGFAPAVGH
jgi:hypothetical protein